MCLWDEEKNESNRAKHGVDFQEASTIFDVMTNEVETVVVDGEHRHKSVGLSVRRRILCVIHTERCGRTRIISARRANRSEENEFRRIFKHAQA